MDVLGIINHIRAEQEKKVIIRWPNGSIPLPESKSVNEDWNVTVTNEPEKHFARMRRVNRNKAQSTFKFEIPSVEEGIQLCKGLFRHYESEEVTMPIPPDIDSNKQLYLTIHILYKLN